MNKTSILSKYFLISPLFILFELVLDLHIRVVLPWSGDYLTYIYLAVCFVFGVVLKNQILLNLFALIESSVNIILLFKSVYIPVFTMAHNLDSADVIKIGIDNVIHFVIVGAVLLYAFYTNPLIKKSRR